MIATVIKILEAMIALPKIGEQIRELIGAVSAWFMSIQDEANAKKIADAAAFALRAKTEEERYAASQKWRDALSRRAPR